MAQRQLDELADLRHLLAHAADVVVADLVELLLVLALDRLALLGLGLVVFVVFVVWGVCWGFIRFFCFL